MQTIELQDFQEPFCSVASAIHQTGFDFPWSQEAFESLLKLPTSTGWINEQGLLLVSSIGDEAEILTICVLPECRGKGIAGLFLQKLFDWAKEQNVKRIFLEVSVQNEAAKKLYLKHGFYQIGVRKNYYKTKNGFCDALCMEKSL